MSFNILHNIYSALFVFSAIVIFEIFFLLKKNRSLKVILLVYTFTVLWYCAANIYCIYNGYHRFLLEIPLPILGICFMALFSMLCFNKISKYVIIFSAAIIVVHLFVTLYYRFVVPKSPGISLFSEIYDGNYFIYLRLAILSGILFITTNLYTQMKKKYKGNHIYFKSINNWSLIFLFSTAVVFIAGFFKAFIGHENLISKYLIALTLFITTIAILFRPKFLNKSTLSISISTFLNKKTDTELSMAVFNEAFYHQLYFLKPEASMIDLSKTLGVSSENLYRFIYTNFNYGFNDLLNENRVNHFKDVVKSKKYDNYTIDALSQMSGFSSRHHLYKPFKKFHGGAPSDFIKSLEYA